MRKSLTGNLKVESDPPPKVTMVNPPSGREGQGVLVRHQTNPFPARDEEPDEDLLPATPSPARVAKPVVDTPAKGATGLCSAPRVLRPRGLGGLDAFAREWVLRGDSWESRKHPPPIWPPRGDREGGGCPKRHFGILLSIA